MKLSKIIPALAAAVAAASLSGCGPDVESCAKSAVEREFRKAGEPAKCAKIANVRRIGDDPFLYSARALVKSNGRHSYYAVRIEMIDGDAVVFVDRSSRADIN